MKEKAAKEAAKAKKRAAGKQLHEEEWEGIQSGDELEEEDGQQEDDEEEGEDEDYAPAPVPGKVKKERRPTGGNGKKQHKYVSEKVRFLFLHPSWRLS